MRRTAITVIACLAALAATVAPAFAVSNGMLAAVADGKLVTLNPDGSGLRTVWAPPAGGGDITALAWSPDGTRLALTYDDKLVVWDLVTGTGKTLPSEGNRDLDPAWRADGGRIGFRRVGLLTQSSASVTPELTELGVLPLDYLSDSFAFAPNLTEYARTLASALFWSEQELFQLAVGVMGKPAWSSDGKALAFASSLPQPPSDVAGLYKRSPIGQNAKTVLVTPGPVGSPRWSPDGTTLLYAVGGGLRTVPSSGGSPVTVPGLTNVSAADWQPCAAGAFAGCVSYAPPTCTPTSLTLTTQSDEPKNLPLAGCVNPGSLALSYTVTKPPANGTMSGMTYTPAPGFIGQDEVVYRAAHRYGESEPITVRIFVVRRAVQASPPPPPSSGVTVVTAPPYLTARAKPRLDRKRTALVRLSCDQDCSFVVRLTGKLKKPKKTLRSKPAKKSLAAGQVRSVRLRLPKKPKGKFKSLYITGTVRNAASQVRTVRLPVRLPR
jgi:hypothetical protein